MTAKEREEGRVKFFKRYGHWYWFTYKKLDSFDLDLITDLNSFLKKKIKLEN